MSRHDITSVRQILAHRARVLRERYGSPTTRATLQRSALVVMVVVIVFALYSLLAEFRANSRRVDSAVDSISRVEAEREDLLDVIDAQGRSIEALRLALQAQGINPDDVEPSPAPSGTSSAPSTPGAATRPAAPSGTARPAPRPTAAPRPTSAPTRTVPGPTVTRTRTTTRTTTVPAVPPVQAPSRPPLVDLGDCVVVNPLTGRCLIG